MRIGEIVRVGDREIVMPRIAPPEPRPEPQKPVPVPAPKREKEPA